MMSSTSQLKIYILSFFLAMGFSGQVKAQSSEDLAAELEALEDELEQRKSELQEKIQRQKEMERVLTVKNTETVVVDQALTSTMTENMAAELGEVKSQMSDLASAIEDVKDFLDGIEKNARIKAGPNRAVQLQPTRLLPQLPPGFSVGGSLRLRNEIKDGFNFNNSMQDYFLTQFRLHLKWSPAAWITAYVEGQDARVFGEDGASAPGINQKAVPNIFADDFDLHQGYIDLQGSGDALPVKLRVGRQKFNLGAKRLVSSLEWVNTARVWDGVRLSLGKSKERLLEAIGSRLVPVSPGGFNDHGKTGSRMFNSYFYAMYYTDWQAVPHSQIEGYWMLRHESGVDDAVHTVGARLASVYQAWDFNAEGAGQFGRFGGLDHRSWALHLGAGFKVPEFSNGRFGLAYNYGRGDEDATDNQHTTFDNQYPLNHAYYGYMDFFALQNVHNAEATFQLPMWQKGSIRVGYQAFWLAQEDTDAWYNAGAGVVRRAAGNVDAYVGSEVDITAKRVFGKLALELGFSHFFPGAFVKDTGADKSANFVYLAPKISF